jgi:class 3 adenylate cyclase
VPAHPQHPSPPLGIGGLHIGRALVGFFGPNQDFAGFGSGIELASQLCERARPDEILCSPAFVAAHGDDPQLGPPRPVDAGGASLEARPLLGEHAPDPDHDDA